MATAEEVGQLPEITKTAEGLATGGLRSVAAEAGKGPRMVVSGKQFGMKVGRHARDFGLDPNKTADREKMFQIIRRIREQPSEVGQGPWHPQSGGGNRFWFYRQGNDVVVTDEGGNFVTILKGGQSNG